MKKIGIGICTATLCLFVLQTAEAGYGWGVITGVYTQQDSDNVMIVVTPTQWYHLPGECTPDPAGGFWRGISGEAFWIDKTTQSNTLSVLLAVKMTKSEVYLSGSPSPGYDAPCALVHFSFNDR